MNTNQRRKYDEYLVTPACLLDIITRDAAATSTDTFAVGCTTAFTRVYEVQIGIVKTSFMRYVLRSGRATSDARLPDF